MPCRIDLWKGAVWFSIATPGSTLDDFFAVVHFELYFVTSEYIIVFVDDIMNWTKERECISRHLESSVDQSLGEIMYSIASDRNGCGKYFEEQVT